MTLPKITQADREKAARSIKGAGIKDVAVRRKIRAGFCDDHCAVQGAAFYRECEVAK
jgi:hypothetical protein